MYDQVAQNKRRSLIISALFVVVTAVVVGALLALFNVGAIGLLVGVAVGALALFVAYAKAGAVVLRISRAVPADPDSYARFHNLVQGLCVAGGLPKPRLYVIDDVAPNAFAAGRGPKHALVGVTTGLLENLDRVELEAVLAHQLSRIKNGDILPATLAVTTVGFVTVVADAFVRLKWWNGGRLGRDDREVGAAPYLGFIGVGLLALSPLLAKALHLGLGPDRSSLCDISAVEMTRFPPGLISALEKLALEDTVVHAGTRATAHLWLTTPIARLESEGLLSNRNWLFDSHPPIQERIATLRER